MVAIFALLEDFLTLWERSEERRALAEESSGVLELLAADVAALEAGQRGDLLAEWVPFDTDGDSLRDSPWPRLRLVRQATPAELARLGAGDGTEAGASDARAPAAQGLLEVVWAVMPAHAASERDPDRRAQGFLWRGERLYGSPERPGDVSFFSEGYAPPTGALPLGSLHEVTGGVLWLGLLFAGQTSLIHDEWRLGLELGDVGAAWDAWARERPDPDGHPWNALQAQLTEPRGRPSLPRRVRLELELEGADDLKWRTRLDVALDAEGSALRVIDPERLPPSGGHVLVGGEWMEVLSISERSVSVRRAARGTAARAHAAGALVHYGRSAVRDVPVATFREDWNL